MFDGLSVLCLSGGVRRIGHLTLLKLVLFSDAYLCFLRMRQSLLVHLCVLCISCHIRF